MSEPGKQRCTCLTGKSGRVTPRNRMTACPVHGYINRNGKTVLIVQRPCNCEAWPFCEHAPNATPKPTPDTTTATNDAPADRAMQLVWMYADGLGLRAPQTKQYTVPLAQIITGILADLHHYAEREEITLPLDKARRKYEGERHNAPLPTSLANQDVDTTSMEYRRLSTILAALRIAGEENPERLKAMPHFIDCEPLTPEEIDELCEELNTGNFIELLEVEAPKLPYSGRRPAQYTDPAE